MTKILIYLQLQVNGSATFSFITPFTGTSQLFAENTDRKEDTVPLCDPGDLPGKHNEIQLMSFIYLNTDGEQKYKPVILDSLKEFIGTHKQNCCAMFKKEYKVQHSKKTTFYRSLIKYLISKLQNATVDQMMAIRLISQPL